MSKPTVSLMAAVASNNVIGADNDMPWRLSTDLKRFKSVTMGKPIIMGRKTYESVGKALPGRLNIVITRNADYKLDDAQVVSSIEEAIRVAGETGAMEIMITGGGQIYRESIAIADKLYITHVDASPKGDTVFPTIDPETWREVHHEPVPASEKDSAATTYAIYERIKADF